MVPLWVVGFLGGWAVASTVLALWYALVLRCVKREREEARAALAALEENLPVVMLLGPGGAAHATLPATTACYWVN